MKYVALIIVVMWSCGRRGVDSWSGIPEPRTCSWEVELGVCVAEGRTYTCIASDTDGCNGPAGSATCAPMSQFESRTLQQKRAARKQRELDQQNQYNNIDNE